MSRPLLALAVLVCGFAGGAARAHPLAPSLLELRERGEGRVEVRWKSPLRRSGGVERRPVLPEGCRTTETLSREATALAGVERFALACDGGGLVGRAVGVTGIDATGSDALLRVELADGRVLQHVLRSDAERFTIPDRTPRLAVARDYARLGVEHIATGADHLLFVLGLLLLVGGGRRLVQTITAFTVGHSITLSLAALGYVHFPSQPIELAIAASVFWLAVDLAGGDARKRPRLARAPWLVAGTFGLLHGLGFAGALAETGLPAGEIPLALVSFNLGIEAGQLLFVAILLAIAATARRVWPRVPSWALRVPVYAMGSAAAFWCIERTALLLP